MIGKLMSKFVGLLLISLLAGVIVSFVLHYVPKLMLVVILIMPIFGAVRQQKNWKIGMASLLKMPRIKKVSGTSVLVTGVVIVMMHKTIFWTLVNTLLYAIGGAVATYVLWEIVRFVLKKWKSIYIVPFTKQSGMLGEQKRQIRNILRNLSSFFEYPINPFAVTFDIV
ncbi:hypothetical protein SD70_24860 [Gordoniibacillus kamchatkensis]|uniref:Uncharacterized protein n=1 Tax=Gordoniibacillus kamchatkensis TaxID=1590651 RepID=A0ABR5ACD6_9BACL|nr:hypothetical protein [Paenibacillus sp. VKM B-2647]KIL38683.1 hypothetical protein SD70_24860 [Paenibacillus sp. VKM B-2647]